VCEVVCVHIPSIKASTVPGANKQRSRKGACNSGSIQVQITYVFPFWKCAMRIMRKRRCLQTVRGPRIFKSTTFLWQIAFTVTHSLGHFTAARSKALRWVSVKFLTSLPQNTWVFMSPLRRSIEEQVSIFGSSLANNLDLDSTQAYTVIARSFVASLLISSWPY